jgi:hypothetical protein
MPACEAIRYLHRRNMKGFIIDSAGIGWRSEGLQRELSTDSQMTVNDVR